MRMQTRMIFAALILTGLLHTASAAEPADTARKINLFGAQLYTKLSDKAENLTLAPFSAAQALLMLAGGAQGETKTEILFTLGFKNASAFPVLRKQLLDSATSTGGTWATATKEPPAIQLTFADSVWLGEGFLIKPAYLQYLQDNFSAIAQNAPFASDPEQARHEINFWTLQNTGNMIRDLLPPNAISKDTRLVLCDAACFDARWQSEFDPDATKLAEFKNLPPLAAGAKAEAEPIQVQMMQQTLTTRIEDAKDFQAITVPYKGGQFSLVVILPKMSQPLSVAEKAWPEHENWFKGWGQKVALSMPRFTIGTTASLREALQTLGIADAFSINKANLLGISAEETYVSDILQGCQIEVTEKGTRAAAVTAVEIRKKSMQIAQPIPFTVNRSFVYLVRHEPTKLVLFVGRVRNLPDASPQGKPRPVRASASGYGSWRFGMTMEEVQAVKDCSPYRPDEDGGLKCIHAPWLKLNDKHAVFTFDGNGELISIRLWLNTKGVSEEQAKEYLQEAELFLAPFGKGKEKGIGETLEKKIAAQPAEFPSVAGEDVTAGPGQPRTRLTLTRHPQLGWYVYLTFSPF